MRYVFNKVEFLKSQHGDIEFASELIEDFLQVIPEYMNEIYEAIQIKNSEKLRNAAHKFKGTIGVFHIPHAFDVVLSLELMGKEGELNGLDEKFSEFESEIQHVVEEMTSFLEEYN